MPTTKANWIFISTFKHSKAAFLQAHQSWRNYSHAEPLLGVSLMRDSPHLSRLALQVVKNCTEEGLCYGISLSGGRGSPQNFLSFQGTVTGSPGDLVAVPCLLTIRCHPFYFNPFPALCPYLENTKEVFLFFFFKSTYFFAAAKNMARNMFPPQSHKCSSSCHCKSFGQDMSFSRTGTC